MASHGMIIQGKTVQAARLLARQLMHAEEQQLSIEVLDRGRYGLFGLFGRPAVIRVTARAVDDAREERPKQLEADRDGSAMVEGGLLRISDPVGRGKPVILIPGQGVLLRVNGVPVKNAREILPGEEVAVDTVSEVQSARVEVQVAPDGLTASVIVKPGITIHYELLDREPANVLQLNAKRLEERVPVLTSAQVEEALLERGVNFGLDREAIEQAAAAADGQPHVVARGEPVREGQDGFVEYLFSREPLQVPLEDEERVNYWDRYIFPSVQEGQVLATLHPPVEGKAGRKVTEEIIRPRAVRRATLRVKEGVTVSEDGRQAIALLPGRPVLEGYREPALRVVQLMVHPGDVDLRSGNLLFRGDILILGNVHPSMQVAAHGNLAVMGNAEGSLLMAGGSIFGRGSLIRCQVRAGGLRVFYNRLAPRLAALGDVLESLLREVRKVKEQMVARRRVVTNLDRRKLVALLVERRKQEITSLVEDYAAALKKADIPFPPVVRELLTGVGELIRNRDVTGPAPEELDSLASKKNEIEQLLHSLPEQPGDLFCSYAQNSTLEASGNIVVDGQGCFNSHLTAGQKASVLGTFRGGEISAGEEIRVVKVGSPGPSVGKASLRVPATGTIILRQVYPEAIVQVGQRSYLFDKDQSRVRVRLSAQGQLLFE